MSTAITFGRFRIVHAGHLNYFRQMLQENDEVIIGVSSRSAAQRSAEVIRSLLTFDENERVTIIYTSTPFTLMDEINISCRPIFYVGADRANLLSRLSAYHDIEHRIIERDENAPSSTACRRAFWASPEELIDAELAANYVNALTIIAQIALEEANG